MHSLGTLSCPFPRKHIGDNHKVLPPILSFEVKVIDLDIFNELKCRICADESRMVERIDFANLYAPIANKDSLRLVIALAAQDCLDLIFFDVSNTFQNNVISDPTKRHYLSIPPLYQK